ncbi:MAG: hypothetical protein HZY76_02430 [Anaerolineae bacterium]|nr:MAG: hypothetical protein HZY76_02430 [Anaerolineae bacterium]
MEDRSTTQLMRSFYSRLMAGARKGMPCVRRN